jgi:enterochelin esterase family protein
MNPALRKLFRKGPPAPADNDTFIAATEFPRVDGSDVTLVWRGQAQQVLLRGWIYGFDTAQPLQPRTRTDLWATTIDLPPGSRIEYKFEILAGGQRQLVVDPLNPLLAHDPFGANSVCQGAGYERPSWTLHDQW